MTRNWEADSLPELAAAIGYLSTAMRVADELPVLTIVNSDTSPRYLLIATSRS